MASRSIGDRRNAGEPVEPDSSFNLVQSLAFFED
jgi:hypothetical protein